MRKTQLDSPTWRRRIVEMFEYLVIQCPHCGNPVKEGYICEWCHKDPDKLNQKK